MTIESSLPLARSPSPLPPPTRPEQGDVVATLAERPVPTRRSPASPLLAHLARFSEGSPLPAEDTEAMLQLATHQEALFLARKQAEIVDVLSHSPWAAFADAEPDNAQAKLTMQEARRALQERVPQQLLQDAEQRAGGSHADFFKEISGLIGRLDKEWIGKYSGLLAGYVGFYRELTNALALIKDQLGKPDKDGMVEVDFTALRSKLDDLKAKWAGQGFGEVFGTEAAARRYLAEVGIEGLTVVERKPGGGWQISIDPDLINSLQRVFPSTVGGISASALNEMMAQKEIMLERFSFITRAIPEKYQRQLQMWDTLVKILSSTIDSTTQADQGVIAAMAG